MSPVITAHPDGFLGRRYLLSLDRGEPMTIPVGAFGRRFGFELAGEAWTVQSSGWRGRFTLERARDRYSPARAEPKGWFSFTYVLHLADRRLELVTRGFLGRRWDVLHGERTVGQVRGRGFFGRELQADLPEGLPAAVRIFIVLTVIMIQRRRAAGAAAAG